MNIGCLLKEEMLVGLEACCSSFNSFEASIALPSARVYEPFRRAARRTPYGRRIMSKMHLHVSPEWRGILFAGTTYERRSVLSFRYYISRLNIFQSGW